MPGQKRKVTFCVVSSFPNSDWQTKGHRKELGLSVVACEFAFGYPWMVDSFSSGDSLLLSCLSHFIYVFLCLCFCAGLSLVAVGGDTLPCGAQASH